MFKTINTDEKMPYLFLLFMIISFVLSSVLIYHECVMYKVPKGMNVVVIEKGRYLTAADLPGHTYTFPDSNKPEKPLRVVIELPEID